MPHERIACINCGEVIADEHGTSSPEIARLYKENLALKRDVAEWVQLAEYQRATFLDISLAPTSAAIAASRKLIAPFGPETPESMFGESGVEALREQLRQQTKRQLVRMGIDEKTAERAVNTARQGGQ